MTSAETSPYGGGLDDTTRTLARLLVDPLVPVPPGDQHRRARLLAIVTLVNGVLSGLAAAQSAMYATDAIADAIFPILMVTTATCAIAYGLARAARTTTAAYFVVVTQLVVPVVAASILTPADIDARSTAAWLSLPVLTASATLGQRPVLAVGLAAILAVIGVMAQLAAPPSTISEGAFFLATVTVLILVYLRHRDGLEQDRQAVLRSRNAELEELKSSLEERVVRRTHQLEQSSRELTHANDTLSTHHALLVQSEKMAAVGRLTAGFAHELASPLSATLAALDDVDALAREYARSIGDGSVNDHDHTAIAAEMATALVLARRGNERAVKFVRGIRAHTRDPGAQATERFELGALVTEAVELLAHAARAANVRVEIVRAPAPLWMVAVPSRVNQVVTNLVKNGIEAIAGVTRSDRRGGVVTLRVRREAGDAVLEIEDDGPGVLPELAGRIFEPLFTTKAYGQGTGLGLSIVREIVQDELRGRVELRAAAGAGATFVVRLPSGEAPEGARDGA